MSRREGERREIAMLIAGSLTLWIERNAEELRTVIRFDEGEGSTVQPFELRRSPEATVAVYARMAQATVDALAQIADEDEQAEAYVREHASEHQHPKILAITLAEPMHDYAVATLADEDAESDVRLTFDVEGLTGGLRLQIPAWIAVEVVAALRYIVGRLITLEGET